MAKYHINTETGHINRCAAVKGLCPFGGPADHYDKPEYAREAYEKFMSSELLIALGNRRDVFAEKVIDALTELRDKSESPRARKLFDEALAMKRTGGANDLHRLGEAAAAKAEIAYEMDKSEDAQVYYNIYMLISASESARRIVQKAQGEMEGSLANEQRKSSEEKQISDAYSRLEQKIDVIKKGLAKFNLWEIIEIDTPARSYRLKEIESSHPRIRDVLAEADDAVLGKISPHERSKALEQMQETGQNLLTTLERIYGREIPSMEDSDLTPGPLEDAPEFELIGGGSEVNVYLHTPSMMVYKVRHSVGLGHFETGTEGNFGKTAVVKLQKVYENQDLKKLEAINATYVKTYFLEPVDSAGNKAALIAQPYLDPREYGHYDPSKSETKYLRSLGFTDAHSGNMSMEFKTGKLILFDCIYVDS